VYSEIHVDMNKPEGKKRLFKVAMSASQEGPCSKGSRSGWGGWVGRVGWVGWLASQVRELHNNIAGCKGL
jgi:hypothetical protein